MTVSVRGPGTYSFTQDTRRYLAVSGSGRGFSVMAQVVAPPRFMGPRDRSRWISAGRPRSEMLRRGRRLTYRLSKPFLYSSSPVGELSILELKHAEGHPGGIAALLGRSFAQSTGRPGASSGQLETVGQLLGTAPLTPEAQRAIAGFAAHINGVHCLGRAVDLIGRTGVAVGVRNADQVSEIITSNSGTVLAVAQLATGGLEYADTHAGEIINETAFAAAHRNQLRSSK